MWSDHLPGWEHARRALRGELAPLLEPARRPTPDLLPPAERRRAPVTVALALAVGAQAVAESGRNAADLPSVFSSAHGDLSITDYLCDTLAQAPELLSPTRFHHSVHNAASGYWTMAVGCHRESVAISAYECSFAQGLLEALAQCVAGRSPVLLVAYDVASAGALAEVTRSEGHLAVAMVLAPASSARDGHTLVATLRPEALERTPLRSDAARTLARNALADALPLLEAIALEGGTLVHLPAGPQSTLELFVGPRP